VQSHDERHNPIHKQLPYVFWARLPKGRHSGITVEALLKYGRRISTQAERDAAFQAKIKRAKELRKAKML